LNKYFTYFCIFLNSYASRWHCESETVPVLKVYYFAMNSATTECNSV